MRVLLVIPGLLALFAGIYCLLGKDVSGSANHAALIPPWVGVLACIAGLGVIVYGAGRRKF